MIDEIILTDGEMIFAAVFLGGALLWLALKTIQNSADIEAFKKKNEVNDASVIALREANIAITHSLNAVLSSNAEIKEEFFRQNQRREETKHAIMMQVKETVQSAIKPLEVEIKGLHRVVEALQKKSE
jgi:hypothetical protein